MEYNTGRKQALSIMEHKLVLALNWIVLPMSQYAFAWALFQLVLLCSDCDFTETCLGITQQDFNFGMARICRDDFLIPALTGAEPVGSYKLESTFTTRIVTLHDSHFASQFYVNAYLSPNIDESNYPHISASNFSATFLFNYTTSSKKTNPSSWRGMSGSHILFN